MRLYFATGNKNKLLEFQNFLGPEGIDIEHLDISYPEIRSDDIAKIAASGAKYVCFKAKKTVIVEDSGLFINSLNSFPGTYTKWVHQKIGHDGLFRLLEGKDRKAEFRTCIGICKPGDEPLTFSGAVKGTITREEKGINGWGHDSIFIPVGHDRTWAENQDIKATESHRINAIKKLLDWLKENK
ncbi:MAG: non-canonical purine NTP pyrophosphatase, RdgB/HAM1 family [Candidatus Nanohalarchaeota archaeon]|nr:MAG: non-canonical purine NTP pyrophosphatase, RdgB/HAM1 family [Candidatus Nanohaloarchaeota archaeon]